MDGVRDPGFVVIRSPNENENAVEVKQRLSYFRGVSGDSAGSQGISMNLVTIPPSGEAEPHCHSNYETAIYLIKGRVLCKYGEGLAKSAVLEAGDFLYIGPNVWHQPINLNPAEAALAVVARNDPAEEEHVMLYEEPVRKEKQKKAS